METTRLDMTTLKTQGAKGYKISTPYLAKLDFLGHTGKLCLQDHQSFLFYLRYLIHQSLHFEFLTNLSFAKLPFSAH